MEITGLRKINPEYEINKAEQKKLLEPKTNKPKDTNSGNKIYPYLSVQVCDNLIFQNPRLKTNIETLAEDIILNNISLEEEDSNVRMFWENNLDEFCTVYKDFIGYGFGAAELVRDTDGVPQELAVIPSETLYIQKEKKPNDDGDLETYYYAIQSITSQTDVKLKLSHLDYPESDSELPICIWVGGGRKSDFFDYPLWLPAFNHVSASVTLDLLNNKKLNEGNLMSGVLVIKRPPAIINADGDEQVKDTLEDKMIEKGNGLFTLELTSLNKDIPLEVDYIQINESNYEYLNKLAENSDLKIMEIFKIPEARLLLDTTTESMNSNKTNTLYKIYTIELANKQRPIQKRMDRFNKKYFEYSEKLELETPVFNDELETQINIIIELFNNGLITLLQAIKRLNRIYPELDIKLDESNPIYSERYYNGNPLGFTDNPYSKNPITAIGDFIEMEKINQVFSEQDSN